MMHANLARWLTASCAKFINDNRGTYTLFAEGAPRNTKSLNQWVEFRLDGPYIQQVSHGCYRVDVELNILCNVTNQEVDLYAMARMTGYFQALLLDSTIPIYKLAGIVSYAADDGSLIGCLQIRDDLKQA